MNIAEAVKLCTRIESFCPDFGCHVALTGGCLYKSGERKDIDILFYRIRQVVEINKEGLLKSLTNTGLELISNQGWKTKMKMGNVDIDILFPEDPTHAPINDGY